MPRLDRTGSTALLIAAAILAIALWVVLAARAPMAGIESAITPGAREPTSRITSTSPTDPTSASPRAPVDTASARDVTAPAAQRALRGRVVRAADRAPVAGAQVRLLHRDADELWSLDLDYGRQIEDRGSAKSDRDGRFEFVVERARAHRLEVHAAGYAERTLVGCTAGAEVLVEMFTGARIDGIVRDAATHRPVADVDVRVAREDIELDRTRTAADGTFRCADLSVGEAVVQTESALYAESWRVLDLVPGGAHSVEIELEAGRTLRGRVLDAATRAPVAGAEISDSWMFDHCTRAGADGGFVLRGVPREGLTEIRVRAAGYAHAAQVPPRSDGDEMEFRLVRGASVRCRLVRDDGTPAIGVYCAIGASYGPVPGYIATDWIRARDDGEGRCFAEGLRPDLHYWLYARGPGYGSRLYALPRLGDGAESDFGDIVLRAAGGIEGRVADESGAPFAGIEVSLAGRNADTGGWIRDRDAAPPVVAQFESRSIRTDGEGGFRFTGLAAGEFTIQAEGDGTLPLETTVVVRDGEVTELALQATSGLTISGTLARGDGVPLGDGAAEIRLMFLGNEPTGVCGVAADGAFRCDGLSEGRYAITVFTPPKGWAMTPVRDVAAGAQSIALVMQPAAKVSGRVLGADGEPAAAQVWFACPPTFGGSVGHATAADGTFEIEVPSDFVGTVGASDAQQELVRAQQEGVIAGQTDVVLRLERWELRRAR